MPFSFSHLPAIFSLLLLYLSFPRTLSLSLFIRNQQGIYTYLSNRADLLVRECVKKYYDCWLVCDDRACNRRTMQQASAGAHLIMTSRQLNVTFPSFLFYFIVRFSSSLLLFLLSLLHSFLSGCLVARIFSDNQISLGCNQNAPPLSHPLIPYPVSTLFISFLLYSSLSFTYLLFPIFPSGYKCTDDCHGRLVQEYTEVSKPHHVKSHRILFGQISVE